MQKKILMLTITTLLFQSCINKKVTQSDVFNPVKEYEISENFKFNRYFVNNTDTTELELWFLKEEQASFNLIYFSGNGSNIRSAIPFFNELGVQFNLNIYSLNYSGYGLSDGKPSIDGIIKDGNIALDYFKNNINDENIPTVVLGYSLGGFVALNLISNDIIDQVIVMSTFTSLEELKDYLLKEALPGIIRPFLKLDIDQSIYQLNNITLVQQNSKPVLFIHGGADDFIPPSMSYNLYNLSPSSKKELKIIEHADHRMVLKDSESNKQVVTEIKKFLKL
ncbi:MAG TPA: hypothetical protein DCG75_13840 [Bacteroidales bacterium]|jgi:hypothetical protein|nr:hypothetical protein [Bacteroidales bacterium]